MVTLCTTADSRMATYDRWSRPQTGASNYKYGGRADIYPPAATVAALELRENASTYTGGQVIFRALGDGDHMYLYHPNVVGRAGCYWIARYPDAGADAEMECAYYRRGGK